MKEAVQTTDDLIRFIDDVNRKIWSQRGKPEHDYNPVQLCEEAFEKAKSINYAHGIAFCTLNLGLAAFAVEQNFEKSLVMLNEGYNLFKELNDKKWISNSLLTLSLIKNSTGKPEEALYYATKGIEYYETNETDPMDTIMSYYVIGTVLKDLKKHEESEAFYRKGLKVDYNNSWGGRIYTSLSNIHTDRGNYEEALNLALKALELIRMEKNDIGESRVLSDIGGIYQKLKKYDIAIDYKFQALKIRENTNLTHFILGSLIDIAAIYDEKGNKAEALDYYYKAEKLAVETKHQHRLANIYQNIASLNKGMSNYPLATEYYEKFIQLTLELNKKEREARLNDMQSALLQEKEQEIERLKNVELKNAYDLITEKNKEITDSIEYARRIQKALMASDTLLKKNLPDHFILYKPKAIVSGDFYWASGLENGNFALITADSTGHGVPGAFMSLLNISFLNEGINVQGLTDPAGILDYTRSRLIQSLAGDGSSEGGNDGMDCILCCFDFKNKKLSYSAANSSFYILRSGELIHCNADKMPVGKSPKENEPFTTFTVELRQHDVIYTFTDGFPDQFGGPRGKKFRHKQLEEILKNICQLQIKEQYKILNEKFEEWKGELEQIDDVLMIGIKI